MLLYLHVKNIAIIREEEIEFKEGLNILSGETGAGKSIILGALSLAMGEKPLKSMIRDEHEEALAEAVFSVNESQKALLAQMGVETPEDEIILQRKITPQRAGAKINGESVPAGKLAEVSEILIDIYGQHEQQTLLSTKNHLRLLDEYIGKEAIKLRSVIRDTYLQYSSINKELQESIIDGNERLRQIDLLEHEINQIESSNIKEGEDEILREEYKTLTKGERIANGVKSARKEIDSNVLDALGRAIRNLKSTQEFDDKISSFVDELSDAESILNSCARELAEYEDDIDLSFERLNIVSNRIDEIDLLKRKYSKDGLVSGIYETLEENKLRLVKLKDYESYIKDLNEKKEKILDEYKEYSGRLSVLRKEAADKLSKELESALTDLNFTLPKVEIVIKSLEKPTENGMDGVCFYISTNPGEKIKPIGEIASGGELSRIMLALKTIFAASGEIDSLVFDEIDSGISGKTASKVAQRLKELSKNNQVICITHLPQIAACAKHHFLIEKNIIEDNTISTINHLSEDEHVKEVARMLAGDDLNEAAMENARSLISGGL